MTVPIDPTNLAVIKGRLEQIADEMDATLFRSAFNPIIAEARDASHGLYHPSTGETLIQGRSGLPIFVGTMAFAVKHLINHLEANDLTIREGDVYLFNDPYDGGTHLSDFKLIRPYFKDKRIFCFIASVAHWHDVGGNVPGNYNPGATESHQEAVLIPPVLLIDRGVISQDIVRILQANSRLPISLFGDLKAQIGALELGNNRMDELLRDFDSKLVWQICGHLKNLAEKMMRRHISQLPDGCYSADDWLDNDGINENALKVAVDVTISGSNLLFDFSRTATQCSGPVNVSRSTTIAACYVGLKHLFKDVPANSGVLSPIEFVIPENSLLAATAPKPVGGYTETILRIIDVIFVAMSHADSSIVNGCAYGTINALSMSGYKASGERWVMFSFFGGGHGGHPEGDGLNHGNAPISMATIPPLEILEAAYPIYFAEWALRPNSGGDGRHRGGLGAIYEIVLREENADVFLFGDRSRWGPPGVYGGDAGMVNVFSYESNGKMVMPPLGSKATGIKLRHGQRVRLETPGGGGYGDASLRNEENIANDLRQGYVSTSLVVPSESH